MSEEDEPEKKKFKRKPLAKGRGRGLGSRRRKRRGATDDEEGADSGAEASDDGGETGEEDSGSGSSDEPAQTQAVTARTTRVPSPPGSGTPDLSSVEGTPTAEKIARLKGSARRFGIDFSKFLSGLGRSAHQQGQAFGREVVKPFSHALVDAAICLTLLFVTGVFGLFVGRYLKANTTDVDNTVTLQNQVVQPGQQIDESFFSEGFDTKELHSRASRVLEDHLKALAAQDFVSAYGLLSDQWRKELSYETFERGYLSATVKSYEVGRAETIDSRHVRIRAELEVQESGQKKVYQAVYLAVLSGEGWRLDGGTFR